MFDTTASGYLRVKEGTKLTEKAINKALEKVRGRKIRVKKLELVELPKPSSKYEVKVSGVG